MSRKFFSFWMIVVPDIIIFYLSLFLTIQLRYGPSVTGTLYSIHFRTFSFIYLIWLLVFFIHGLFELNSVRRYTALVFNLLSAMVVSTLGSIIYFYFQPNLILTPRRFLLYDVLITFVLALGWYLVLKYILRRQFLEKIYLFSFNNELALLEKEINEHSYLGFKVLGHLNEQTLKTAALDKNIGIILPKNLQANESVLKYLYELRKNGVNFYNHDEFYENLVRRVYLTELSELWFLENVNYTEKKFYNLIKRALDIVAGLVLAVVFLVSFPIVALLVKLSSRGNIFIIQDRVGKNGKVFKVYKYRTMFVDEKNVWTTTSTQDQKKITAVGKFLRKSRVDEWPQALNLILGNMSLVGPRPEQPKIVEELKKVVPFYDERHLVKPGLTGWAQLNVYAATLEETKSKLQYDLYYIKNRSFVFDLEIILKTLYYIFTWQGR